MSYEPISSTLRRKQEEVAAAVIQRAYRKQQTVRLADKQEEKAVSSDLDPPLPDQVKLHSEILLHATPPDPQESIV